MATHAQRAAHGDQPGGLRLPGRPVDHRPVQRLRRARRGVAAGASICARSTTTAPRRSTRSAEARGVKSARDLVVLVAVNLYLEAVTAASRIELAQAQLETAQALVQQATDLKASGLVANVDVLRAQVQIQNQRQRSIVAENDFEKAKLQLARAIGLPPGQAVHADRQDSRSRRSTNLTRRGCAGARLRVARRLPRCARPAGRGGGDAAARPAPSCCRRCTSTPTTAPSARRRPTRIRPTPSAATVRVPLFEAGRAQARRAEGDALLQRRRAELEDIKGQIDIDVRTSLLDVRAAAQQLEAAQTTRHAGQPGARAGARSLRRRRRQQHRSDPGAGDGRRRIGHLPRRALRPQPRQGARWRAPLGVAETAIMQYLGGVQ